jgi:hypothetical protein
MQVVKYKAVERNVIRDAYNAISVQSHEKDYIYIYIYIYIYST